jgi:hypothetical protein
MAMVAVADDLVPAVGHGKVLDPGMLGVAGTGPWAVVGPDGALLAVYEACADGRVKPAVVLAGADRVDEPIGRSEPAPR